MTFVIDTGPLTHFAQARLLPFLQRILAAQHCVYPPQVAEELCRGEHRLVNQQVLTASWLEEVELSPVTDALIPSIRAELGGPGDKNLGESQCLALAKTLPAPTYLDDGDAGIVAARLGVDYWTTLELIDDALTKKLISASEAVDAIDALIRTGYRLPISSGEDFLTALGIALP